MPRTHIHTLFILSTVSSATEAQTVQIPSLNQSHLSCFPEIFCHAVRSIFILIILRPILICLWEVLQWLYISDSFFLFTRERITSTASLKCSQSHPVPSGCWFVYGDEVPNFLTGALITNAKLFLTLNVKQGFR